jgi:Fur family zinc uptake transcriptional regulator
MSDKSTKQVLQFAQQHCQQQGLRLTVKRSNVLQVMLDEAKPLSAYDIMAAYQVHFNQSISVVSIYRMLEFLIQARLVHKLLSSNQYLVCSHITCSHAHKVPMFLICDNCNQVEEVGIKKSLVSELKANIVSTNFKLQDQQLELHGICSGCRNLQ